MKLWKDSDRGAAQELVSWLLSTIEDSGGWSIDWVNMIAVDELPALSSQPDSVKSLFNQTLREMKDKQKRTLDDFEAIFEVSLKAMKASSRSQSTTTWQFFIPINVHVAYTLIKAKPRVRILGKVFSFTPLKTVERRLGKNGSETLRNRSLLRIRTRTKLSEVPSIFLVTSANGSSWHDAWKEVESAFDALRGMIELTFDFFGFRLISEDQGARCSVPHPLWMIAHQPALDTPEWIHFITDEDSDSKPFELTSKRLIGIQKNSAILAKKPKDGTTLSLIANCLRLYSQAMDARFRHLSFLGFWQLAEAITNAETFGGKTDRVVGRLAWHGARIGLKGSGYRGILGRLAAKRNAIVHRGMHDIRHDDINAIKFACEAALDWLFREHKSLPTILHIEQYYRLREMSNSDIAAIDVTITRLKKARRSAK